MFIMLTDPAALFSRMLSIRSVPLVGGSIEESTKFLTAKPTSCW